MSDPRSIMDVLQDPQALRDLFSQHAGQPPPAVPDIDIPLAHPLPSIECKVEIRLEVAFDPWQIGGVPYEELKGIVWSVLTNDPNYVGGIRPRLTFVAMQMEQKADEPSQRTHVANAPTHRADDAGHDSDSEARGGERESDGGDGSD